MLMKTYTNASARIIKLLKEKDWSQTDLAKKLDVSPQAVQQWVKGTSSPRGKNLSKLADITGLPQHWFFIDDEPEKVQKVPSEPALYPIPFANLKRLPIVSWEQAGNWDMTKPITEMFTIKDWIEVMANVSKNAFVLRMKGDAMRNPQGTPTIPEGSLVVIEPEFGDNELLNGKIVLAQDENSKEPMIKKLLIDGPNVYLTSLNPEFTNIKYSDISKLKFKGKARLIIQELED